MTEIPEHLLKRSQQARAKATGQPAPAADAPATSTEVVAAAPAAAVATAAAAPAPAAPKPDTPVVAAYKARKKIPVWAMGTLSILPVWMFMYVKSVTPTEADASTPMAIGEEVYGYCSTCHGGDGGGGSAGRQLNNGEVLATFPRIEDQISWVIHGTRKYEDAGISVYGDPDRAGGARVPGSYGIMPSLDDIYSDAEILAVVCDERYNVGGADPADPKWAAEYEKWCSPESEIFAELEEGVLTLAEIPEIGEAPRPPLADQTPGAVVGE